MQNKAKRSKGGLKAFLVGAVLLGLVGATPTALAQNDGEVPAAAEVAEAPVAEAPGAEVPVVPATPAEAAKSDETPEVGSNADIVTQLKEVKAAYSELKKARDDNQSPVKFAIAALIAAIANLLLSGVKRAMKLTGRAKKILPWVAVGLGAAGTIAMYFAGGMSLFDSILYGGAAAGAIVLQELGLIPIKSVEEDG